MDPVSAIANGVGSIFGWLGKSKDLEIEQVKTQNLRQQLESAEDLSMQETIRKKLDLQITKENAAVNADKMQRIGSLATFMAACVVVIVFIVQIFKYKKSVDIKPVIKI